MTEARRAALVVVDMQQGFADSSWGATTNVSGCEENVTRLLDAWSAAGLPIVIVHHDSTSADSPLSPTRPGNALVPAVASAHADLRVAKSVNSAFYGTPDLEKWLRSENIDRIVVCGIQANMCVETTARMGGNLGFDVVVPLDATRTFDLAGPDGVPVSAATLMQITAANLQGGGFARVVSTADVLAELAGGAPARGDSPAA